MKGIPGAGLSASSPPSWGSSRFTRSFRVPSALSFFLNCLDVIVLPLTAAITFEQETNARQGPQYAHV